MPLGLLILIHLSAAPSPELGRSVDRFQEKLRAAGLYLEPEYPKGCLEWKATPKGEDSIWIVGAAKKTSPCDRIPSVETWIVPVAGGEPYLVSGPRQEVRTPLELVAAHPSGSGSDEDE